MSDELTEVCVLIVSLDRLSRAGLAVELDQQPGTGYSRTDCRGGRLVPSSPGVYDPDVIVWDVSRQTALVT